MKNNADINYVNILFSALKSNLSIALWLWLAGLTVIGVFAVYGLICYKGFSIGYSISSIIATLGVKSGSAFVISYMLLQNIIFIPALFAISISRNKIV